MSSTYQPVWYRAKCLVYQSISPFPDGRPWQNNILQIVLYIPEYRCILREYFFSGPSLVVDLVVDSRLIMLIPSRFLGQKSISLAKKKQQIFKIWVRNPRDPITLSDDDWGVQSPPKCKVFRLHYHSQKVIGSLGKSSSQKNQPKTNVISFKELIMLIFSYLLALGPNTKQNAENSGS